MKPVTAVAPAARLELSRAHLIRLYYARLPWRGVAQLAGAGVLLALFHPMGLWLLGAAMLAALALLVAQRQRPSDERIDAWLEEALHDVEARGMARFNLVREQLRHDPLLVHGPVWRPKWGVGPENLRVHRGADGRHRFSVTRVLVLYLTHDSLHLYSCTHDALRGLHIGIGWETYVYSNIVGVKVFEPLEVHDDEEEHHYKIGGTDFRPWQRFSLTFKNGEAVAIDVAVGDVHRRPGSVLSTRVEDVAGVVSRMLTEAHTRA